MKESNWKPNKIWIDKGSEFYNRSMESWLEENDIETYSTHNEGKSVVAEKLIRTLDIKICKCMISISKKMYIDKLDDIVNKDNNIYHRTIKIKPVDVNQVHKFSLVKKLMKKILTLKLMILLEYQNIKTFLQKIMFPIGLKMFLLLKKFKILCREHMLLVI